MICRTRAGSASAGGRGSAICTSRRWCFSSTRGAMSAATSSTVARRSQLRGEISNWPDSMRATSSRSLTRSTSRSVDCSAIWMKSSWRGVRLSFSVDCSSSMKPLIEVSGLRSSCDAVATKSLLACSRRARSVMSRSVQTTPPSGPARRAAVTAIATPPCSTVTSPTSAASSAGSGLAPPCAGRARAQLGDELARARVHRHDDVLHVADDEAVAEALDRRREALALGLDARAGDREVGAHDVERLAERRELLRAVGVDAHGEVAAGHLARRVHEVVERAAHRADEQREEREHGDEREPRAEHDRDERRARAAARVVAGFRAHERPGGRRAAAPRGARPAGAAASCARVEARVRAAARAPAPRAGRARSRPRSSARLRRRRGRAIARARRRGRAGARRVRRSARSSGVSRPREVGLERDRRRLQVRRGDLQRRRPGQAVLVVLAGVVERGDPDGADDREADRQAEQGDAQRAGDRAPARGSSLPLSARAAATYHRRNGSRRRMAAPASAGRDGRGARPARDRRGVRGGRRRRRRARRPRLAAPARRRGRRSRRCRRSPPSPRARARRRAHRAAGARGRRAAARRGRTAAAATAAAAGRAAAGDAGRAASAATARLRRRRHRCRPRRRRLHRRRPPPTPAAPANARERTEALVQGLGEVVGEVGTVVGEVIEGLGETVGGILDGPPPAR